MTAVQTALAALRASGWTLAAIATETGYHWTTLARWQSGVRVPPNPTPVLALLATLAERKRIPKRKRYGSSREAAEGK